MTREKIISFYGTTQDELVDLLADKLAERFASTIPQSAPIIDEAKPLSVGEASEFTGLARQTLYKLTSEGTIPHHKNGGRLWFFRDELIAWIKNERPAPTQKLHLR